MLANRQYVSVMVFYYLGYSRVRNLIFRAQRKPVTRFIALHDIPFECVETFKKNMQFLKRCTNVISLDDYFAGRLSSAKINVVITFDDGFRSWITFAVPTLQRLELPAIFFVSSGFVNLSETAEKRFARINLDIESESQDMTVGLKCEDLKRLAAGKFTLGGHTVNHTDLSKLEKKNVLEWEIFEDKMRLEQMSGAKIRYFAYPRGMFENSKLNIADILKKAGYKGALTTVSGFNNSKSDPYFLCRDLTSSAMPLAVFKARVYGNYDGVKLLKQMVTISLLH